MCFYNLNDLACIGVDLIIVYVYLCNGDLHYVDLLCEPFSILRHARKEINEVEMQQGGVFLLSGLGISTY